jgi:flagellar biosynthetic protein FlhB
VSDQKTEKPTPRRLEKARKEGRFPISREFVSAAQFLIFVWVTSVIAQQWFGQLAGSTRALLYQAFRTTLTADDYVSLLRAVVFRCVGPLVMLACALTGIALAAQLFATKLGISMKKLAPDLNRLNGFARLKDLPRQNLQSVLQCLVLAPVFAAAVWAITSENLLLYSRIPLGRVEEGIVVLAHSIRTLLWRAGALFLILGFVDLFRQRRRFEKELRMTKQEIRDEFKETEGNPQIKQRVRRLQRDLARRNMMKEIPKATAVVVNPTHYAVAIRYSLESAGAPVVLAKGKNYLAARIRQRATEHGVPIVENQPLAQALYKAVEVGQEIPAHLYRAVAEVLAYIYKIMHGRLPA